MILHKETTQLSQIRAKEVDEYKVFRKGKWVNPNGDPVESELDITGYTRKSPRAHTINFELSTLRTFFYMAIKWGYIKENPIKGVTHLKAYDLIKRLKEKTTRTLRVSLYFRTEAAAG